MTRAGGLAVGLGLCLCALALVLLVPRGQTPPDSSALRLLLVDVSPSATRVRTGSTVVLRRWLVGEDRSARGRDEEVAVVLFGSGAGRRRVFGPAPAGELEARLMRPTEDDALGWLGGASLAQARDAPLAPQASTDLAGALNLAATLLGAQRRPCGTLRILTDGTHTGADSRPAWRACSSLAAVEAVRWPPPDLPDAALDGLDLPRRVEEGAPLAARVDLSLRPGASRGPLAVELEVAWSSSAGGGSQRVPVAFTAEGAGGRVRLIVPLGPAAPGITDLVVRVVCPGDPCPENDRARASTRSGDALVCAVLAPPDRLGGIRRWLGADPPGLQMRLFGGEDLAVALAGADVLWTIDLAPDRLDGGLLRSFVEAGGGWLSCGGWGLLQGWLPAGREDLPQSMLPLQPRSPGGERDVILVVDGSGSMAGKPFEEVRRGILEMARATLAGDRISLRFFTGVLGPDEVAREHAAGPEGERGRRRSILAGILQARVPGGTTDVLYSLDQLAAERERGQREALVLLLTDGRTALWDPERARAVAARLARARARLRVFPIGSETGGSETGGPETAGAKADGAGANREFLRHLVAPGEELAETGDLRWLGEVFQREVNRQRIREGERLDLVQTAPAGDGAWEGLALAWEDVSLPPVRALSRAEATPGASVLWTDSAGEPVLGLRTVGLGATALLATDPAPRASAAAGVGAAGNAGGSGRSVAASDGSWAPAWAEQGPLLRPLLRVLGRGRRREIAPRARWDGGELVVDPVPHGWPALVMGVWRPQETGALARPGDGPGGGGSRILRTELTPGSGPGGMGERWGPGFPLSRPESGVLELRGPGGLLASLPLAAPRAPEFDPARIRSVPAGGLMGPLGGVSGGGAPGAGTGGSGSDGGPGPAGAGGLVCLALGLAALTLGGVLRG